MGDEELSKCMAEDPREPFRLEMHVRRFGGGSSENPRSSACHACSFGDTGARRFLTPVGVGMVLSVEDERTLGDVFILRNTGVEGLVDDEDALFVVVVDLDNPAFVGVAGRRTGLGPVLDEGEGVRPLLRELVLRGDDEAIDGDVALVGVIAMLWLLRGVPLCISLGFDLRDCIRSEHTSF